MKFTVILDKQKYEKCKNLVGVIAEDTHVSSRRVLNAKSQNPHLNLFVFSPSSSAPGSVKLLWCFLMWASSIVWILYFLPQYSHDKFCNFGFFSVDSLSGSKSSSTSFSMTSESYKIDIWWKCNVYLVQI